MTTTELRQKRHALHQANDALIERARKDNRHALSESESSEFEARDAEMIRLDKQIEYLESHDARGLDMARSTGVVAGRFDTAPREASKLTMRSRILTPEQRVADWAQLHGLQNGEPTPDFSLGDMMRAMTTGATSDAERRALSEGTDSAGGYTVPVITATGFIDKLRKTARVFQAGASTVPLSTDKTSIARVTGDPTGGWRNENAAVVESDLTFDNVLFNAQTWAVVVRASRELIEDSVNIESALENALVQSAALELDRVALLGSGTSPEPRGVVNQAGINSLSMGVNGLQITSFDKLLDVLQTLQDANAQAPTAMIMAPRTSTTIAKLKDTTGRPLDPPFALRGIPMLPTTQIGVTDTQGTAVGTASRIIAGYFPELWIGMRTQVRIEVLKERYADNLQYGFLLYLRGDVQLAHPASFVDLKGIIP